MRRLPLLPAIQNGTLVLLTGASLFLGVQLAALSTAVQQLPLSDEFANSQQRLQEIATELDGLQQMDFVTSEDFRTREHAVQEKLKALAHAQERSSDAQEMQHELKDLAAHVQSAQDQLLALKAVVESLQVRTPPSPVTAAQRLAQRKTLTEKPAALPFNILGVESRGGALFLTVAAMGVTRLDDVELMRVGGSYLGWRLDSLMPDSARFRRPDGSSHNVTIK